MTKASKPTPLPTAAEPSKDGSQSKASKPAQGTPAPKEIGGPKGPEPTRYGDWERNGRCSDF